MGDVREHFFFQLRKALGQAGGTGERQNGRAGKGPGEEEARPHLGGSAAEPSRPITLCVDWRGHEETRQCALMGVFFFFNPSENLSLVSLPFYLRVIYGVQ